MSNFKKINKIEYLTIAMFVAVTFINYIAYYFDSTSIRYVCLAGIFTIFLFSKLEYNVPMLFFIHPNTAMFDDIGFSYLFNICIFLTLIKMILFKRKFDIKLLTIFLLLIVWELLVELLHDNINTTFFTLAGWIAGYLILIVEKNELIDCGFEHLYKWFYIGYVLGFIGGILLSVKLWGGFEWPLGYRFTGMLRDPNYYNVDALILISSSYLISKKTGINKYIFIIPLLFFGFFSVSKMFLIMSIVTIVILEIIALPSTNFKQIIGFLICSLVALVTIYYTGLFNIIIDKFNYRFETTEFSTGRNMIQSFYIKQLFSSTKNLLIGGGVLEYPKFINSVDILGDYYGIKVAHNTYLDVVLSWGVIGTSIYVLFLYNLFKRKEKIRVDKMYYGAIVCFMFVLYALSYLQADTFSLILLFFLSFRKEAIINDYNTIF